MPNVRSVRPFPHGCRLLSSSSLDSHPCALCSATFLSFSWVLEGARVSSTPSPYTCFFLSMEHLSSLPHSPFSVYFLQLSFVSSSREPSQTFKSRLGAPTMCFHSSFSFPSLLYSCIVIVNSLVGFRFDVSCELCVERTICILFIAIFPALWTSVGHMVGIQKTCVEWMNTWIQQKLLL